MGDADILLVDLHRRVGVAAALVVQDQRVASHRRFAPVRAWVDLDEPTVPCPAPVLGDGLADDDGLGMRRRMDHLAAGILVLPSSSERHGQDLRLGSGLHHVDARVLHGDLGAEIAVDPFHRGIAVGHGALGDQVVRVGRPVLNRGVAAARAFLHNDLHHRAVQRVGCVDRRRAPFHIVHIRAGLADDERALKLPHVLSIDAEVRLQWDIHMHAGGDVHERPTGPDGRVQRSQFVVFRRDHRPEVLAHDVGVLPQRRVGVQEDDPELLPLLFQVMIDRLTLVLRACPGQKLPLRLRDPQLFKGVLDILGNLVPAPLLLLRGLQVVVDVVKVDLGEVGAPDRHGALLEMLERMQPVRPHPLRLILH